MDLMVRGSTPKFVSKAVLFIVQQSFDFFERIQGMICICDQFNIN